MKKNRISLTIGVLSTIVLLVSCAEKEPEKEVIVVPGNPVVVETVVVEESAPESSTTVTFGKKGVKIEAENVDVEVKK